MTHPRPPGYVGPWKTEIHEADREALRIAGEVGTPYVPPPDDDGGGGAPIPTGQTPEEIYETQLDWLNSWLQGEAFAETGAPPPGQLFGDLWTDPNKLDQALTELGYLSGGGGFVPAAPPSGGLPSPPDPAVFGEADINIGGAPDWWKALTPDVFNPISEYQTFSNLLIPFLSPEDQRTAASNLFQSDPTQFASYDPELLGMVTPPSEITPELRQQFFSGERANKALQAMDRLLEVTGKSAESFGPGYNFLRGIMDAARDMKLTSGATQLTETQQDQLLGTLDPMLAATKSKQLSAFGPLARSFVNPFFSAGALSGEVKNRYGQLIAPPNPKFL